MRLLPGRFVRVLPLLLLPLAGCASQDLVLGEVRTRVGSGAIACGLVLPGADSSRADACSVSAFRSGAAFWVGYGSCGDAAVFDVTYLVSMAGRVVSLRYETRRTERSSRFGPVRRVTERPCEPVLFQVAPGHLRLGCEPEAGRPPDAALSAVRR